MKVEQKIVMVYTILAVILGFLTNHFYVIFGLLTAVAASFALYFVTLPILVGIVKKKKTILFYNSFVTFLLVWLTVWILLYNLGG